MLGLTPRRLVFIAFLVAVFVAGKAYIPAYYSRFQFGDDVRQTVKYAAAQHQNHEVVRKEILRLAEEDGVPITTDNVKITRRGYSFTVDVEYIWTIDLRGYHHEIPLHVSETRQEFGK